MPLSFGYKRYFIMLNEEEKGYEITGGKQPTGYVGIELKKNKIRIKGFIQNIKTDAKSDYRLFLLASGDSDIAEIGRLRSENGKGEITRELDFEGKTMADYSSAIVMAGDSVVLFGFNGESKEKSDILARYKKRIFKAEEETDSKENRIFFGETLESKSFLELDEGISKEAIDSGQEEITERIDIEDAIKETDSVIEKEKVVENTELIFGEKPGLIDDINETTVPLNSSEVVGKEEENIGKDAAPDVITNEAKEIDEAIKEEELFTGEGSRKSNNNENKKIYEETVHEQTNGVGKEEELFTGECSSNPLLPHFYHHFHQTCDIDKEPESEKDIKQTDKYPEITQLIKNLKEVDNIEDFKNRRWFSVGDKLHLLEKIIINVNGIKFPLSYPYFVKGCGPWVNKGLLGAEYDGSMVKKILIGLPGAYMDHFKPYFKKKGFTKHIKVKKDGKARGYWIMCIDLHKGTLCEE